MRGASAAAAIGAIATLLASARPALGEGDDQKRECADTSYTAQKLRGTGRLREAETHLELCARASCPAIVRAMCRQWLDEVDRAIPSVVVGAVDPDGHELRDAVLTLDGQRLTPELVGRTIPVDPGAHTLRGESGGASAETSFVLQEGEKAHNAFVTLPSKASTASTAAVPPPSSEPAPARMGPPVASWISFGVGALGLGAFTVFGLAARRDYSHFQDTCAPNCTPDDVSDVRTKMNLADGSLLVGLVAIGVGAVVWLSSGGTSAPPSTARSGPP